MEATIKETITLLKKGDGLLWAVVMTRLGSSPRSLGSRMIIRPDGSILGSIGGGRLEADTLKQAPAIFSKPERKVLHFQLSGKDVAETKMICGGMVDVFLEPLMPQDPTVLPFLEKLMESLKGSGLFITSLSPGAVVPFQDSHLLVEESTSYGQMDIPVDKVRSSFQTQTPVFVEGGDDYPPLLLEPVRALPVLYIFGGGHISLDLARLARMVDFHVAVVDDRPEFANRDRFPFADRILLRPFDRSTEGLTLDQDSYIVIVTRGHLHDLDVLRQVIGSNARYIGMIGSRRKKEMIMNKLLEEGVPKERLDQVYAPIGLDIKAETPAEIAVSIVGEMIRVRAQGHKGVKNWKI